jgi:hypothetical protein
LEPREGWQEIPVAEANPYASVQGTYSSGGLILAYGRLDRDTLGVWRSSDGRTWEPAGQPPLPTTGTGGSIADIVSIADGFLAVAVLGNPEGSEPYDTGIYRSADGSSWVQEPNPQTGDIWLVHRFAKVGERLIVAGDSGVWISDDDGRTWTPSPANGGLGGSIQDLAYDGDRLVAVGYSGEMFGDKVPVMWTSTNGGASWDRTEIGASGAAYHVLLATDGGPLILGSRETEVTVWRHALGDWADRGIGVCCVTGATSTPTGFVAVGRPYSGGPAYALASEDGDAWIGEDLAFDELRRVSWSSVAQLIATTDSTSVVLGPAPYP